MATTDYRCPKCGSDRVHIRQLPVRTGLYCSECNAFIKYLDYSEILKITRQKEEECENTDNYAVKKYAKRDGVVNIKCSNCNAWLYRSDSPIPTGQFNLINAKFCPCCGKEFI